MSKFDEYIHEIEKNHNYKASQMKELILEDALREGWNPDMLDERTGLIELLNTIGELSYELNNNVRGGCGCETYSELGSYLRELAIKLDQAGTEIEAFEEEP